MALSRLVDVLIAQQRAGCCGADWQVKVVVLKSSQVMGGQLTLAASCHV